MIALLAAALFAQPTVLEIVDPAAHGISIQALVKLPDLGAKDLAKLQILVRAIPKQTQDYPRRELLTVTDGVPAECTVLPDIVRVSVSVPSGDLKTGLSITEALLREATLTQDNLDEAAQELPKPDYWTAALEPDIQPVVRLAADEAQVLYHRVFRPDRVILVAGGNFAAGTAKKEWQSRMDRWTPDPLPRGYFDISKGEVRVRNPGAITTIDFEGPVAPADDASLPTRILSLFALGEGKGASLFRIVRQEHTWSYRQEAILSPARTGWIPRLLIAGIPSDDVLQRVETIRSDLLADIQSWTPATRDRAVGMAAGVLLYGVSFSPFYVLGDSPPGPTLADQTFMAGYWYMKTGRPWDPPALLDSMKQVSLDDLKAQATSLLSSATVRVLPGT